MKETFNEEGFPWQSVRVITVNKSNFTVKIEFHGGGIIEAVAPNNEKFKWFIDEVLDEVLDQPRIALKFES